MLVGTIIFYNLDNGSGLILSQQKDKYKFDIEAWNDFDYMPEIGLKVILSIKDGLVVSVAKHSESTSIKDVEKTILQASVNDTSQNDSYDGKLVAREYSTKTVPSGFVKTTLDKFFSSLNKTVDKYKNYQLQSIEESLDYFKIKRFLFTAYNNLLEIDSSLADGKLTETYINIQDINSIYDIYKKSYMYPKIAFSTIFLRRTKYKEAKIRIEMNILSMESLKASLPIMESKLKINMKNLSHLEKDDSDVPDIRQSIKHIKRLYVDAIDKIGTLREENEILLPITNEYFDVFFEEFNEKFTYSYEKNIKSLIDILDSMAFLFDRLMWEKASSSKPIIAYFKKSNIAYPYSCITFLRYYLKTLDKSKLSDENQGLFDLLEYLEKRNKKK